MRLRVLSWNLKHGRSVPGAPRELLPEFTAALEGWEWDVAILQEVPPWWPAELARALDAEQRRVLTSRNSLLALRRWVARRRPELIKSGGGGSNAILVRADRIAAHRAERLCLVPERRWVHGVRLGTGVWIANLHASTTGGGDPARDARRAASAALGWAAGEPLLLGGDFNVAELTLPGLQGAGGAGVDHAFVAGLEVVERARALEHGRLSDHAPILVVVEWEAARPGAGA